MLKGKLIRCRYLEDTEDGKTRCKIYEHHIGTILNRTPLIVCKTRKGSHFDYPNCPYNTNKPIMRYNNETIKTKEDNHS